MNNPVKFSVRFTYEGDDTLEQCWWENYEEDTDDIEQWAKDILDFFHRTIKPYEKRRKIVQVVPGHRTYTGEVEEQADERLD